MTGETLEEKIRRHAPGAAAGYYLIRQRKDGEPVRYPAQGAFRLKPYSPPSGAPFGSYILHFVRYETDTQAMAPVNAAEDFVRIQLVPPGKAQEAEEECERNEMEREGQDVTDAGLGTSPAERMADLEVAIASTPALITARADFEKQRMAMELAENNQELLNKGNFSRDAAEALALNRAYRREAQVTLEAQANLSRRTAEEVQSHWTAFRMAQETQAEGMRLLKEQLQLFAKPAPPPPPVDYTPAVIEGLRALRDFGVAIVQARAGIPFAPPASSALSNQSTTAKLMPDSSAEPTDKEPSTSTAAPAVSALVPDAEGDVITPTVTSVSSVAAPSVTSIAGVIDPTSPDAKAEAKRLLKSLGETTELEALFAMLSPEQFQAFLKRLRQRSSNTDSGSSNDAA